MDFLSETFVSKMIFLLSSIVYSRSLSSAKFLIYERRISWSVKYFSSLSFFIDVSFVPVEHYKDIQNLNFNLLIDSKEVQRGCTADMLFKIDDIIAYVSQFVTLKIGDLLFTGTPVGVGPVSIGQRLQGYLEEEKLLDFYIR